MKKRIRIAGLLLVVIMEIFMLWGSTEIMAAEKTSAKKNGWIQKSGEYYYYENNKKVVNTLLTLEDGIYYVDKKGKRQYGWQDIDKKRYFFEEDGKAHLGWMNADGDWYYFNQKKGYLYRNIVLVSGNGDVYVLGEDGKRCSGWFDFQGQRYYAGKEGYAYRGMCKIGKKWYYFDPEEAFLCKNQKIVMENGDIYYFDKKGVMYNKGFKTLKSGKKSYTYYFQSNGKAKTGWMQLDGKWYHFSKAGIMKQNCTVTNAKGYTYEFDKDGVCTNRK